MEFGGKSVGFGVEIHFSGGAVETIVLDCCAF